MSTKKILLLLLIGFILLIGFSFWAGQKMSKFATSSPTMVSEGSWLRINPSGMVADYNEILPLNLFGNNSANSIQGMCEKIRAAATDKRITGILLEPSTVQISLPAIHEIALALDDYRKSGKPVLAFGDFFSHGDYLLASLADEIYMEPSLSAGIMLSGVSANILFYKELFDKLGIKMHIIQAGEFKGAGEPYSQTSLSEGTRQNIETALADRFELIVSNVAKSRKLTPDDMRAVYNNREDFIITAPKAKELKLIDHALSRSELLDSLAVDSEKLISIADYTAKPKTNSSDKIAVVYLSGNITEVTSGYDQATISHAKVKKIVKSILEDNSIKAAVVRVDSPGGSALESELIYNELLKLKRTMPLVISMGGTAASGGYYISCASDYLIADPGTITGSIGVIMMLPETTGLGKKIGMRSQTIRFGKYAGAMNPFEPVSPELIASLQRSSIGTYDEFKSRVMTARKISPDKINSIAEGRIYSAEDAKVVGLIDQLGSLKDAVSKAAELASMKEYQAEYYPRKVSFLEAIKDSDLMKMKMQALFTGKWWDSSAIATQILEKLQPSTWQYLMPFVVE